MSIPSREALCPLAISLLISSPPGPGNHSSMFCLYGLFYTGHSSHINEVTEHVTVCVRFLSLSTMFSKVHVSQNIPLLHSFYDCMQIHNLPIYNFSKFALSLLSIMNNVAMNIPVQTFLWTFPQRRYVSRNETAGHVVTKFYEELPNFSTMIYHSVFSPAMYCFNFSTSLPKFVNACFFNDSHRGGYEMVWLSNCSSDLHFPNDK